VTKGSGAGSASGGGWQTGNGAAGDGSSFGAAGKDANGSQANGGGNGGAGADPNKNQNNNGNSGSQKGNTNTNGNSANPKTVNTQQNASNTSADGANANANNGGNTGNTNAGNPSNTNHNAPENAPQTGGSAGASDRSISNKENTNDDSGTQTNQNQGRLLMVPRPLVKGMDWVRGVVFEESLMVPSDFLQSLELSHQANEKEKEREKEERRGEREKGEREKESKGKEELRGANDREREMEGRKERERLFGEKALREIGLRKTECNSSVFWSVCGGLETATANSNDGAANTMAHTAANTNSVAATAPIVGGGSAQATGAIKRNISVPPTVPAPGNPNSSGNPNSANPNLNSNNPDSSQNNTSQVGKTALLGGRTGEEALLSQVLTIFDTASREAETRFTLRTGTRMGWGVGGSGVLTSGGNAGGSRLKLRWK
jgi:hypothetical protein